MATATSNNVSKNSTTIVNTDTAGIRGIRTNTAVEISWMSRWPAVRLAVSRTPKAKGRIKRLIVSMTIRMGIKGAGVPSGSICPRARVGWFRRPIKMVANHNGTASPRLRESWVVGVNVYGRRPNRFIEIKNIIKEDSRRAQLCPLTPIGSISCLVNIPKSQFCVVDRRLVNQWLVVLGKSNHGSVRAKPISGTPSIVGLINWSKKLKFMVNFRVVFFLFLCFVVLVHFGI